MNFVKASIKHRQVTFTILFLLFAFGLNSLINMPRREDPRMTIPAGLVIAYLPGANVYQVEDQLTSRLEDFIFRFEEVRKEKTYSVTSDGMVTIYVWLHDNVKKPEMFWNKLRHQWNVVKVTDLPEGVIGPVVNSDFGDTESMIIALESDDEDFTGMKHYMNGLADRLRQIPAISKLELTGTRGEQITVTLSSEKLTQYGISLQQVVKLIQSRNTISSSGSIRTGILATPLHTSGYYISEADIREQIAGASETGALIRLSDISDIRRDYAEAESSVRVNGKNALLLAVQMHEGKNIVKTGKEVEKIVAEFSEQLPSGKSLTTIVNQPMIVGENILKFMKEFLMAITAVILIVFLLLPFRIALVSASAIPMTVSITFALMHVLGIELHQVSLASLIAVLGLVVDDAIIIADNYVELLDRGHDRWTAAWRSASDLVVPVFTATATIIAAFLPLIILKGVIGEFIRALPLTVTISLSASFLVAMLMTPVTCFLFIGRGLHGKQDAAGKSRRTFLDLLQNSYNRAIDWCMRNRTVTIGGSLITVALAALLFITAVRHKFFPEAERNQFIIELWMPAGTKLEKTEEAIDRMGKLVEGDERVRSFAVFSGRSAPRFYYNYSPEIPSPEYAQILINTVNKKATMSLYNELREKAGSIIPEGRPAVKLMQQGQPLTAQVEIRISGNDISDLKNTGEVIKGILRKSGGSSKIRDDFREDVYGIRIEQKEESEHLGFTTGAISQMIHVFFSGYPVSTLYEGDNPVRIVLRLDEHLRSDPDDLRNTYLQSPVSGSFVPLRQIADLSPEWNTGRIIRRNGIRTLTVLSDTRDNVLPSELLASVRPELARISLPQDCRIWFGGEHANKIETYNYMALAFIISLISIFIILLLQFRNLKEAGLVMLTIPLSLFGAAAGLIITGNDFGFTAFCGIISLSGIVVRNAIILIDHTNELRASGMDIPSAAYEAGKRRLRPIFLTAMAAAIGVFPMIVSGSPLWSPLASVIAFGVIWGMLISTLVIPVLYAVSIKAGSKKFKPVINPEQSGN
ncbi:MAG TPA: efflux RND transporter permease subunit [Bacteroidales bacterium]|jgi:multidrug efflux pump subunit AcrB|nr:efflux RND transporter permease subunit [Bacteroidales bacterium]HQJ81740.1 efflux RND transporter permease subunit [Bacteroidales bacterium]